MPRFTSVSIVLSLFAGFALGCDTKNLLEPSLVAGAPLTAKGGPNGGTEFATLSKLPALSKSVHGEAYSVSQAGSIIAGYSGGRSDVSRPGPQANP